MIVNPYCRNYGWLFEDLKASLAAVELEGVTVTTSETPLPEADAWICIRANEFAGLDRTKDMHKRTVVQLHDYRPCSPPIHFGAVQMVNERQRKTAPAANRYEVIPLGPRAGFRVRESMPERPTVGWVGRDVVYQGRHIKRPELFVEVIKKLREAGVDVQARIHGGGLSMSFYVEQIADMGAGCHHINGRRTVDSLQRFYESIDVLISTTEPEPGPLSIFEALACGVPVVSTETGALDAVWPRFGVMKAVGDPLPLGLASEILATRERIFVSRRRVAFAVAQLPTQERWAELSVELAVQVAG